MRERLIKIAIFTVSFFLTLIIASAFLNKGNTDMTVDMEKSTLPVINMRVDGFDVNTLFGYTSDMEAKYLRDTLTPFKSDRRFSLHIYGGDAKVESISYEVRSCGADRLVEKTDIYGFAQMGDAVDVDFAIKDLVEPSKEYLMVLAVGLSNGKSARYYTRIAQADPQQMGDCLDFVKNFHDSTFDKERSSELTTYLESNEEGDNSTYQYVNIHSSLSQVSWGDLKIKDRYDESLQIYDMNDTLTDLGYLYRLDLRGRDRDEVYLVREYYRIRYTPDRIYLLDYERRMYQIFDPEGAIFANDKIVLGITGDDVRLSENSDGSAVVFTQCDALYEYKNEESQLAKVFSFYDEKNMDIRDLNDTHEIRCLSVDENGNAYFLVYGYMNRGRHEGKVGVCLYYYDNLRNYIEEKLYIPYSRSWEMLDEEVKRLSYVNKDNQFFIFLDKNLYRMDLDDGSRSVIAGDIRSDRFVSSRSGQVVAWLDEKDNTIKVMDLGTGIDRSIRAMEGETLTLAGFLGDDVVYGISSSEDMVRDRSGIVTQPMHILKIEDKNGYNRKEYSEENVYVISTSIIGQTMHLKRVKKTENGYRMMDDDQIIDNKKDSDTKNRIVKAVTKSRETVTQIALTSNVGGSIKLQIPREVKKEGIKELSTEGTSHENEYYVYGKGRFCGTFLKPYRAVNEAATVNGIVLNDNQEYIWQKESRVGYKELTDIEFTDDRSYTETPSALARCIGAMLRHTINDETLSERLSGGETALSIMRENTKGKVLDLSGCELSSVLYYIGRGEPVLAYTENGGVVLIVGYDDKNTLIMDPETGTKYKKGMMDSTQWFEGGRNRFIVTLPQV